MRSQAVARVVLPEGRDKKRTVEAMFDRVAPRYERMNRVISLGLDRRWRRRTVDALDLATGSRVLDLACGTGDLCRDLEERRFDAVGVDLSAGMLTKAHTRAPLVRGDADALPFDDESFDGLVCGFALRNFVALDVVFAECSRILHSGGRFAALDAAVPDNPVLRAGNSLWFRGAVPLLGRVLARDADAYRYLPESTAYLPSPAVLVECLEHSGFVDVEHTTMTGGSVQLLTGTRA
jgi:demethylmenaquinone methyltransferase / 2-methoxy-6-polyprenyl-1,4-benzoquinol methylase